MKRSSRIIEAKTAFISLLIVALIGYGCGNRAPIVSPPSIPARDLNIAGLNAFHQGYLKLAEEYFLQSIAASEAIDHRNGKAEALYNLALVHRAQERYDSASKELESAKLLFRQVSDEIGLARSVTALATIQASTGRDELALRLIERALPRAPRSVRSEMLIELASIHLSRKETASARSRAKTALSGASNDMVRADALFIVAKVDFATNEFESAREHLLQALEIDRNLGRRRQLADTLRFLSEVAKELGQLDEAEDCRLRAEGVDRSLQGDA